MARKSRSKKQKSRRSSRRRNSRRRNSRRRRVQYNAGGDDRLREPVTLENMITIRDYFPNLAPTRRRTAIVDRYTWRRDGRLPYGLAENIYTAPSYFPISRLRSILPDYQVEWTGVPNPEEYFVDNPFRERLPHQMSREEKAEVIRRYSPRGAFDKYRDRQYTASQYWLDRAFDRNRRVVRPLPDELTKKITDIAKHLPADLAQTFIDEWLSRKYRGYQGDGRIMYPPLFYRRYGRPPVGSGINL